MNIAELSQSLGIDAKHVRSYGDDVAKIDPAMLTTSPKSSAGKLVLVSAITPTPAGEGKTTTSIGLAQGLAKIGESPCLALREPSLGPVFGRKGGATGGGASMVHPADRINLHFTGDFHAIAAAHNLLAAMLDNHIHFRTEPRVDPRRVEWPRVMDMNDRALRKIMVGLGGTTNAMPREGGFEITAASEVMAALCLAENADDLRARLGRLIVAYTEAREPVRASDLRAEGAMLALLNDALWPNLVRTTEGVPAFIHGGPFANIAHGCNSVLATRMAMHVGDWAITEAGFGFDLGAEKFFDIKCRSANLQTAAVVLVATVRALKYHGGVKVADLEAENVAAVKAGLPNLERHLDSVKAFGQTPIVCLNQFAADTPAEMNVVRERCAELGLAFAVSNHFGKGGDGATDLARALVEHANKESKPVSLQYELSDSPKAKIEAVAKSIYGADSVAFTKSAEKDLRRIEKQGFSGLPICIAKTQSSLSDDAKKRGRPTGFEITVREVKINAGAGFLVVLTGEVMRMPGLPRHPNAFDVNVGPDGIVGVS